MIVKPYERTTGHHIPRHLAGAAAESQTAHYLHRRFRDDPEVYVLHGLRLEDHAQSEQDGSTGVCQIDHLLVHRWGMFLIESKSVTEEVRVRSDGSEGDEWSRLYRGNEIGMPSPIRQAQRQSEFLRVFLQRHRMKLLGRQRIGLRTVAKVLVGTDQRGFKKMPLQIIIAVSDKGKIRRVGGWKEPCVPFRVFVTKADLVTDKIDQELEKHMRPASMQNAQPSRQYGNWRMEEQEVRSVAEFLAARHMDRPGTSSARPQQSAIDSEPGSSPDGDDEPGRSASATCKHCGSGNLTARWGKYGYYLRCGMCEQNTAMSVVCSACGTKGMRGKKVRIRKDEMTYSRDCEVCGHSEVIWTDG